MNACWIALLAALVLALPTRAISAFELQLERTVTLPAVSGASCPYDFADINGDGHPEIFCMAPSIYVNGTAIICYDYMADSLVFTISLPYWFEFAKAKAADINRDQVVDFVVAGQIAGKASFIVAAFDGASNYTHIDSLRYSFPGSAPICELGVADYDFDGHEELLVALESIAPCDTDSSADCTAGHSYLFDSFPDSLSRTYDQFYYKVSPLLHEPWTHFSFGLRVFNSTSNISPYNKLGLIFPVTIDSSGLVGTELSTDGIGSPCSGEVVEYNTSYRRSFSWCAGHIDPSSENLALATFTWEYEGCVLREGEGNVYRDSSAYSVSLYRLLGFDAAQRMWSTRMPMRGLELLYHPNYSGSFFALHDVGDSVMQFSGATGEVVYQVVAPFGDNSWASPFPDNIPRLINCNGLDVSFYQLAAATDTHDGDSSLPMSFTLGNPYPNPFNPTTSIPFSLPLAANVKLEVFNLLGQSVGVIAEERFAAGDHSVTWDASGFPSSLYLIRVIVGQTERTAKVLLLK